MICQEAEFPGTALKDTPARAHPENEPAARETLEARIWSYLPICLLSGLIGMTYGAAALSSALAYGTIMEIVSLLPLVAALVAIVTAWTTAMFCMCKEEAHL